jgi:mevalonate kinase
MSSLEISAPSKTFLLGEYAVLRGKGAILLATEPRFRLRVTPHHQDAPAIEGIHAASPAGKMLASDSAFYSQYRLQFIDPFKGLGGFGASSAQFLMLYALKQFIHAEEINDLDLLTVYRKFAWQGEGEPPSGADLICQRYGHLSYFSKQDNQLTQLAWPFPKLSYVLIHTGTKLATHEHLKGALHFNENALEKIVQLGLESLENKKAEDFVASINQYAHALQDQQLLAENTQNMLQQLCSHQAILAGKGCGALGADVIIIFYNNDKHDVILTLLKQLQCNVITHGNHTSHGLEIRKLN